MHVSENLLPCKSANTRSLHTACDCIISRSHTTANADCPRRRDRTLLARHHEARTVQYTGGDARKILPVRQGYRWRPNEDYYQGRGRFMMSDELLPENTGCRRAPNPHIVIDISDSNRPIIYFYFVGSQKRDGRAQSVRTVRGTARRKTSSPAQGLIVRQAYDIRP